MEDDAAEEVGLVRVSDDQADDLYQEQKIKALAVTRKLPPDQHPLKVYLARLAPSTRRTMLRALQRVAHHLTGGRMDAHELDWTRVRYQHTTAVRAVLAEKYSAATTNQAMSALRGVLQEAWLLGHMSAEDYHRAARVQTVPGSNLPRGRAIPSGELRALFDICEKDGKPGGIRDAAIMGVLYGCGLRRAELVSLDLDDYKPAVQEIRVKRGKGRKARICYPPAGTIAALNRWIEKVRGTAPGPLFGRITRGHRLILERLTDQAVLFILNHRGKQAKIGKFSPHDMRRTFIGDLLDAGNDIATVQKMAGHANIQTTARYDRREEVTRKRAAQTLFVPYGGE